MSKELNKAPVEQAEPASCQGTNCGTTTGDHSSECLAEAAAGQGWELKPGDLCGRDCPIHKILAEQAGGDERAAFEAYRDRRNALLESEGHNPGSKWHVTNAHYPTWEASREAMAQPSPKCATCGGTGMVDDGEITCSEGGIPYENGPVKCVKDCPDCKAQPSPAQAEAERPEVVARVVHSNPVVLGQCGPLNANDELMTVAQHAASVARWAEMFNRVEQQRDAALSRVEQQERTIAGMNEAHAKLAGLYEAAQAQHSVPDHAELLQALERTHAGHMVGHDQSDQPKGGYSDGYVNGFGECIKVARKVLAASPAQAQHSGPGDIMRDAQRYRWLRYQQFYFSFSTENSDAGISSCTAGMSSRFKNLSWVDAAIDSAIAAAPGKEGL